MRKISVILFFLLLMGLTDTYASRAMGGEFTVTHFNGPQYKVQMRFWRFTVGIAAPQTLDLRIQNLSNLAYIPNQVLTIDSTISISPGFAQEVFYSSIVTFPNLTDRYQLSAFLWGRAPHIVNLGNSVSNQYFFSIETIFTPVSAGLLNSSPRFLLPPEPLIPWNQPYVHGPFCFDPDGDSLVYRLDTPLTYVQIPLFSFGFLQNIPIFNPLYQNSNSLFNFDSQSGTLNWTPNIPISFQSSNAWILSSNSARFQYTYSVEEWRNGQLIGTVMRDMQLTVVNNTLNTTPPAISINGNSLTGFALPQLTAYAGSPFNFSINISDPDPTVKSFRYTGAMFQGSNAAVITTSGISDGISSIINWIPPHSMVSNKAHMLNVRYIETTPLYSFSRDIPILITVQPAVAGLEEVQGGAKELQAFINEAGHVQMNFTLSETSDMSIYAYDVQGRKLGVLVEGRFEAGQHQSVSHLLTSYQGMMILRAQDHQGWQQTIKLIGR